MSTFTHIYGKSTSLKQVHWFKYALLFSAHHPHRQALPLFSTQSQEYMLAKFILDVSFGSTLFFSPGEIMFWLKISWSPETHPLTVGPDFQSEMSVLCCHDHG